jgi:Ca-activated chloride channel homolog
MTEIAFGAPQFLWLLAVPAVLLAAWMVRFAQRRRDIRRLRERRTLPVRERFAFAGDLPFWLCLILASAFLTAAAARPQGPTVTMGRAGLDIVILQDGSASMQVSDGPQDESGRPATRWQRSMRFIRELGNALSWADDRMALTVFAHIATPQVRLTSDPNTVFFFLDHLRARPPFRIEEDSTWDTNLEEGIKWGLRLLKKDLEVHGPSPNARLFVLLSDGEAWSGEVARSIEQARDAGVPLFVIGTGTLGGGPLPEYERPDGSTEPSPGRSRLDRGSLQRIAAAGAGGYFELDRESDREITNAIIDSGRRLAPPSARTTSVRELYWPLIAAAAALVAVGAVFVRERVGLGLLLAAAAATMVTVGPRLF